MALLVVRDPELERRRGRARDVARQGRRRPETLLAGWAALALVGAWLGACTPQISTHGHRLDAEQLAQIETGRTTREEVAALLGSPSAATTFDNSAWYYVSQRTERESFYKADITQQEVVTIRFDEAGRVALIDRSGLDQAVAIDPVDRETPTAGRELTALEQFVGNIGRFNLPETDGN